MRFPGHTFIIANSYAMVNEFCDEKRFPKTISALKVSTNKSLQQINQSQLLICAIGDETCNT